MRLVYAAALILALAVPARAQWQSVAPGFKYERIQGGPGFLLRYELSDPNLSAFYCPLRVSRDGGATWTGTGLRVPSANGSSSYSCQLAEFYFDAGADGAVTAYLEDAAGARGVFRTTDGVAWSLVGAVPAGEQRLFPRVVGATVLAHPEPFRGSDRGRLLRLDGGAWTVATPVPDNTPPGQNGPQFPSVMGSLPHAGGRRAFGRGVRTGASGRPESSVFVSDDLVTWAPAPDADSLGAYDDVLDFGTGTGLLRAEPFRLGYAPTASPPFVIYAVRRSTDGGQTWASPSVQPPPPSGYKVFIDARTAFAYTFSKARGSDFQDLWLTRDAGVTWTLVDTVPYDSGNYSRFVQTDGRYLYYVNDRLGGTATPGGEGGLFRRPLADYQIATAAAASPEASALALAVGPNPARGTATLRVTLAEAQSVRVTLVDVLGREALRLERALPAGASAVPLDLAGLAPGVYVARLVSPGASASVRFTVAR